MKPSTEISIKTKRSQIMAKIRSKDTKIEQIIRSALHKDGYRFFKNYKILKGCPDIVLKKYSAVVFVNGCFWHGHNCSLFKFPKTNTAFWESKIRKNIERDHANTSYLLDSGWKVCILWECSIRNKPSSDFPLLITRLENWLHKSSTYIELKG